jgi:hypothetical protein
MGFDIELQDERGTCIKSTGDPTNILHRVLPEVSDETFPLLRFVDWWGNTIFNGPQMEEFLEEWERVMKNANGDDDLRLLTEIRDLAGQCRSGIHLYLKFIGD